MVTNGSQNAQARPGAHGDRPANASHRPPDADDGDAAGHCLTAFFIPGIDSDVARAERFYSDLREATEAELGGVAHKRRILRIACRRHGTDCTIEVGEPSGDGGRLVVAIFQLGRESYTVHCRDPEDALELSTMVISRRTVYAVTDFD